jgi:hypothetical protein
MGARSPIVRVASDLFDSGAFSFSESRALTFLYSEKSSHQFYKTDLNFLIMNFKVIQ